MHCKYTTRYASTLVSTAATVCGYGSVPRSTLGIRAVCYCRVEKKNPKYSRLLRNMVVTLLRRSHRLKILDSKATPLSSHQSRSWWVGWSPIPSMNGPCSLKHPVRRRQSLRKDGCTSYMFDIGLRHIYVYVPRGSIS